MKSLKKIKHQLISKNKKAYFDYEIIQSYEAGIQLFGYEVKSIRGGNVNLKGSYISIINQELYLKGVHIGILPNAVNKGSIEPDRDRKIFLKKKDIVYFISKIKESGISLVPLEFYFSGNLIKVKVGLVQGRKKHDKKQVLKERTLKREADKHMKNFI